MVYSTYLIIFVSAVLCGQPGHSGWSTIVDIFKQAFDPDLDHGQISTIAFSIKPIWNKSISSLI